MNDTLFQLYCQTKALMKRAQEISKPEEEDRLLMKDWQHAIEFFDAQSTEYQERYDRLIKNQESFTREQVDFICWQIVDWYLEWKDRLLVDLQKGEHRLGFAKEKLKNMICGE